MTIFKVDLTRVHVYKARNILNQIYHTKTLVSVCSVGRCPFHPHSIDAVFQLSSKSWLVFDVLRSHSTVST